MTYQYCPECHRVFPDNEVLFYCPGCGRDTMQPADPLTAALVESAGTIVVMSDRNYLCANLEGEWLVYTNHNPPRLLYRGPDLAEAVRVLKEGKER